MSFHVRRPRWNGEVDYKRLMIEKINEWQSDQNSPWVLKQNEDWGQTWERKLNGERLATHDPSILTHWKYRNP